MQIHPNERIDDLQLYGLQIIQRPDSFRFGTDAVLLADFAAPRINDKVVDFGTGTGVLPLLMVARQPRSSYDGLEIQADMADMARRSVELNGLENKIRIHHADLRDAPSILGRQKYTLVVCNPPYGREGTVLLSKQHNIRVARHEGASTLEEIAQASSAILKTGGRMAMIYPAPRAYELMSILAANRLQPKRIRTIHSRADRACKLVLLEAVRDGGSMLHWLPPLVLHQPDGRPTDEYKRIYHLD